MSDEKLIPIELLAAGPSIGMNAPTRVTFSYDGREIRFLAADEASGEQNLFAVDIETGEKRLLLEPPQDEGEVTHEEELRRQRLRLSTAGISRYDAVGKTDKLFLPLGQRFYFWSPEGGLDLLLDAAEQAAVQSPKLSPDGGQLAYVQEAEIYVLDTAAKTTRQLTSGARGTGKTNGLADYISQEELGRMDGFWWSPDGEHIAYTEVDETHIPAYYIVHQGKAETDAEAYEAHRFPFAGAANPRFRLGVIPAVAEADSVTEPVWMDLDFGEEVYIGRIFWWDKETLGGQIFDREQEQYWIVRFDIATGERTTVLYEQSEVWFTPSRCQLRKLKDGAFLMLSERDGFQHIYHHAADGSLIAQLTEGDWVVDRIQAVDQAQGIVYFLGNQDDPRETHLYMVGLEEGEVRRLTTQAGTHGAAVSTKWGYMIDLFSAAETPPTVTLRQLETGEVVHTLHRPNDPRLDLVNLFVPEQFSFENRAGVTLYGALYRPLNGGDRPHPTVVYLYGGPGPQLVTNSWALSCNLRPQYLAQQGFQVVVIDNRGSARRGLAFEGAIKLRMGTVEVEDQVDVVNWLVAQGAADPERIGVYGWSYGGYMTLMCLLKAPEVFKVGVAGAPVTSWDGYDTAYTERYMSTPQKNPEGYAAGSALNYVQNLQGKLLLVHGMIDENVHFRHTARLINALVEQRKPYDLQLFPDQRHSMSRESNRVYYNEVLAGYFVQHL